MRISDWSSDVCSSDLHEKQGCRCRQVPDGLFHGGSCSLADGASGSAKNSTPISSPGVKLVAVHSNVVGEVFFAVSGQNATRFVRSEEHTSELQSLMRISYAVFCLKKKKKNSIT